MAKNPLNKGILTENAAEIGAVSREMIHVRACELALIAGRASGQVTQVDYEEAKRELAGGSIIDPQERALDDLPESERWDPVPGSSGREVPASPCDDEEVDDEGRSQVEQLVEQGAQEAEHDKMLQAARAAAKTDKAGL